MYHENVKFGYAQISYYDRQEEIPDICTVSIPGKGKTEMSYNEMIQFAETEEWYVIVNECNWGVCDHWVSIPFRRWITEYYPKIIQYENNGKIIGYARLNRFVTLTKNKDYWKAEVWNS